VLSTILDLNQLQVLLQVLISMLLGGLIGFEREVADRPAGLRTHMLVAAAATIFVALGTSLVSHFQNTVDQSMLRSDPIRIIEAVITGISFLGAGTIIRRQTGGGVQGLTTAASILIASAIGICAALNLWVIAVGTTLLTLLTLRVVHIFTHRLPNKRL
jgi:putative Mg2+ transporter-C (MgtC) family protein